MSEVQKHHERHEHLPQSHEQHERQQHSHEQESKHEAATLPSAEQLAKAVEAQAVSGKEFGLGETEHQAPHSPGLHQELKANAYRKTLRQVRQHLPASKQVFSSIVHQKTVEAVSEAAAKTIGRPSGIMGGALAALLASAYLLFAARYYGYPYNFSIFVIFLVAGFFVGLTLELVTKPWRRRSD